MLLACGVGGLYVSDFVGPSAPIYPSFLTQGEEKTLANTLFVINAVMGVCAMIFTMLGSLALRIPFIAAVSTAFIVGVGYHALTYLRAGEVAQIDYLSMAAYLVGMFSVLGVVGFFVDFSISRGAKTTTSD